VSPSKISTSGFCNNADMQVQDIEFEYHAQHSGASILGGVERAISHIFKNGGVDRLVISTNLLRLVRQIVE